MSEPIKMISKDGEERMVQPVNIRAYQRQGWQILLPPAPEPSSEPAVESDEPAVIVTEEILISEPEVVKTARRSRRKSG